MAEDFARELFDIERGFFKTARALTVRPRQALRAYLRGDRSRFMSPGRYLLAAIVINFGAYWGLGKAGFLHPYGGAAPPPSEGGPEGVADLQASFQALFNHQETQVFTGLVVASLLAIVIGRLFKQQVASGAKAAALGCLLAGHAGLLEAGAAPALAAAQVFLEGTPAAPSPYLYPALFVPYTWATLWLTFGPTAWTGLKAAVAIAWTAAEAVAVSTVAFCSWALWTVSTGPVGLPRTDVLGIAATGALSLAVLLGHVVAEAYLRRRP
jgi:hypothetical protein